MIRSHPEQLMRTFRAAGQPPVQMPRVSRCPAAAAQTARNRDSEAAAFRRKSSGAFAPQCPSVALSSRTRTFARASRSPPPSPHFTPPPALQPAIATQTERSPSAHSFASRPLRTPLDRGIRRLSLSEERNGSSRDGSAVAPLCVCM